MVLKIIPHNSDDYRQMLNLRIKVLLNPIGVPATFIEPENEKSDFLIGAFNGDELIGCCVLTPRAGNTIQLRQMAVSQHLQGTGIGAAIVAFAEKIARENHYKTLMMHARSTVVPFYLKSGYTITGAPFYEVGIEHCIMQKSLL